VIDEEDEGGGGGGGEGGGSPAWMATFADLMSLLLTFFILILSFANMDVIKFSAAVESLHEAFGRSEFDGEELSAPIEFGARARNRIIELDEGGDLMVDNLFKEIQRMVRRANLENLVEVENSDRGVVIRVVGHLLFDAGSTELHPESYVLLNEVALLIKSASDHVSIEGHTDATPAGGAGGASNWHLSTSRAISVLDYLTNVQEIEAQRLSVRGYGATRPIAANDTPEHRGANRRVEFVFERPREREQQVGSSRADRR